MKKVIALFAFLVFMVGAVEAGITLRYYNKDAKEHTMKVKIQGRTSEVEFGGSRTASVTIQGSTDKCVIFTDCGEIEVEDGDNITIKDGCIKIN